MSFADDFAGTMKICGALAATAVLEDQAADVSVHVMPYPVPADAVDVSYSTIDDGHITLVTITQPQDSWLINLEGTPLPEASEDDEYAASIAAEDGYVFEGYSGDALTFALVDPDDFPGASLSTGGVFSGSVDAGTYTFAVTGTLDDVVLVVAVFTVLIFPAF